LISHHGLADTDAHQKVLSITEITELHSCNSGTEFGITPKQTDHQQYQYLFCAAFFDQEKTRVCHIEWGVQLFFTDTETTENTEL